MTCEGQKRARNQPTVTSGRTYEHLLVGRFLPLPVHGVRWGPGELAQGDENNEADPDADGSIESDSGILAGRRLGAGAVGAERNPVCWNEERQFALVFVDRLPSWPQVHGAAAGLLRSFPQST